MAIPLRAVALSTKSKLRLAWAAGVLTALARRVAGLEPRKALCARRGIEWELDLSEGFDLSIYLFGCIEMTTSQALSRLVRPGMTVLDVGANIGAHALPMAKSAGREGRVYAIEPTDWAFRKLLRNLELNPGLSGTLVPVQAALLAPDAAKPEGFYSSWSLSGKERTHPVHGGVNRAASGAQFLTLDDFVRKYRVGRVDLIKIDVDGYDVQVLRGAAGLLAEFLPELIFELCPHALRELGDSPEELLSIIRSYGYSLYHDDGRTIPSDAAVLERVPEGGSLNLHARPPLPRL